MLDYLCASCSAQREGWRGNEEGGMEGGKKEGSDHLPCKKLFLISQPSPVRLTSTPQAAYRHLSSTRSVPAGTGPQIKTTTGPGLLTDFSRRFLQTPLIGQNSSDIEL